MRSFEKLIFILVFCSKYVVSDPFTPDGYKQRSGNTRHWPNDENAGDTSDRYFFNTPTENNLKDYSSHQETDNPIHQQRSKNIDSIEYEELVKKPPLLERDEAYRKERNRQSTLLRGNEFDNLPVRQIRNEMVPSNQMNTELFDENSKNTKKFKSSYLGSTKPRQVRNHDILNYEKNNPVNNIETSGLFNKYEKVSDRQENSVQLLQKNPSRLGDNPYNIQNISSVRDNSKSSIPTLSESDDVFDSEKFKQHELLSYVQPKFPRLLTNIEPIVTSIRNKNTSKERTLSNSDRLLLNNDKTIQKNNINTRMDLLHQDLQIEQNLSNEYGKHIRIENPIEDDESPTTNKPNFKKEHTIRRYKQNRQPEKFNLPKVSAPTPVETTGYDNSDYDSVTQEEHLTKSILDNIENSAEIFSHNVGHISQTTFPVQLYSTSDFSKVNKKSVSSREIHEKKRKHQNNVSKSEDKLRTLNGPSNLSEDNDFISNINLPQINSSYGTGNSNSDIHSLILEEFENPNTKSSVGQQNLPDNMQGIERTIALDVPIAAKADRSLLNIEDDTSNDYYSETEEQSPESNKKSLIVPDSESETPIYSQHNNKYLKTTQPYIDRNQKTLNNESNRNIEINNVPPPTFDLYENDQEFNSNIKTQVISDKNPTKVLTTFTRGQNGIDMKIENDNMHIPAAIAPLVKIINKNLEERNYEEKNVEALNSQGKKRTTITEHLQETNYKNTEKAQKHDIPIVLNNESEKRTFKLNENIPLTVDFSGPIDEIDINYYIGEENSLIKTRKGYSEKSKKETVKTNSSTSGDSNGEQDFANEKDSSNRHTKSKDKILQKTEEDSPSSRKSVKRVKNPQIYDGSMSDTVSSTSSNTETESEGGISSFFSGLFNFFANHGSSENASNSDNSDGHISNKLKRNRSRGHAHKEVAQEHRLQPKSEKDKVTLSPIEVANEPIVNNSLNYKTDYIPKRTHLHTKKSKHSNVPDEPSNKQKSSQLTDQYDTNTAETQDSQSIGHLQMSGIHKHRIESNVGGDDEIITLSPIEVPQEPTENDSYKNEDGFIFNGEMQQGGHSHGKKKKCRRSGSDMESKEENIHLLNKYEENVSKVQNQEISHIRKGDSHKLQSGYNFDNDEIITLSPIEEPQPTIDDSLMHDKGPVHAYSSRVSKTKRKHGDSDTRNEGKFSLANQQGTQNNQEIDFSRIIAKSKPLVWHRGNGDNSENSDDDRNKPDIMYMFQIEYKPIIERDTKTFIFPNGTMIKEFTETTYKDKQDKEPTVVKTTKVIYPDQPNDGYPF